MGKSRMGKSSSSDFFRKSSAKLKDSRDLIIGGKLKKERGTFWPHESLKSYMEDEMRAVRVRLYLDPMKAKAFGFGHEFLVADLQTPENPLVIRAEKDYVGREDVIKAEKDDAGMEDGKHPVGGLIKVTPIDDPATFGKENKDRVKYDVDLHGSGKILMKDLIHILGDCNRCYFVWKYNCWKYAYDTFINLLEKIEGLADTFDDCKKKIPEALEKMPRPSLPAEILEESGLVLLGLSVAGALTYGGTVVGLAAFKYLQGSKKAGIVPLPVEGRAGSKMAGTVHLPVEGLAGSSHFKSSVVSAFDSLAKRPWVKDLLFASCGIGTGLFLASEIDSMRKKHSCSAKAR